MATRAEAAWLMPQRTAVSGFDRRGASYYLKCVRSADGGTIAAALSDGRVKLLDAATLVAIGAVPAPGEGACVRDVCFGERTLWICYSTGVVVEWAPASGGGCVERAFVAALPAVSGGRAAAAVGHPLPADADDADERGPFSTAVNARGDVLAVGYEETILFYDLRGAPAAATAASPGGRGGSNALQPAPPLLACFSSSHSGPVVQLLWHPSVPRHLLSGSDDGLVCVFDTGISGEDDALVAVLNAESGVARFGVFGPSGAFAYIVTRTDTVSLWGLAAAERVADFGDLKGALLAASGVRADYLVDCWYCDAAGRLVLLAGDHDGRLWALDVTPGGAALLGPLLGRAGAVAHASTVRTAVWAQLAVAAPAAPTVVTGSSAGVVCWTAGEDGQLVQWADNVAEAVLQSAGPSSSDGGGAAARHAPSWRAAAGPLAGLRADAALARRSHGSGSGAPVADAIDGASAFGRTKARPVSPPAPGSVPSPDLLALLHHQGCDPGAAGGAPPA